MSLVFSFLFLFLCLIALIEGYYGLVLYMGRRIKTLFQTHTRADIQQSIWVHLHGISFGFCLNLRFGERIKKHLCVIVFPLRLQCTIKIESTAAGADKRARRCREKTRPSGLQTITIGVNYSLHHRIYPEKRNGE